jgi:hypothetical protein
MVTTSGLSSTELSNPNFSTTPERELTMKNLLRAFALSLVVTGAVASAHITNSPSQTTLTAKSSAMPVPYCAPDDANACGIGKLGW